MRLRRQGQLTALCCFGLLGLALQLVADGQSGTSLAARILTGAVRTGSGQPLDGVTVSARAAGTTFTTTVFTDEDGRFVFPALKEGRYSVWAQAVGFELSRADVDLALNGSTIQNFALGAIDDFTLQLSGSQWMAALPADTPERRREKQLFQVLCTSCHVPQFVLQNRFDEAGWRAIITSMETFTSVGIWVAKPNPVIAYHKEELARYLAEMRGPGPSPMRFEVPPRPRGDAARAVITEFDISPGPTPDRLASHDGSNWSEGAPSAYLTKGIHDVVPDLEGNAWVIDSISNKVRSYAKIDATTGRVTDFAIPGGGDGYVRGGHSVAIGSDGIIWMDIYPARTVSDSEASATPARRTESLARIDPKTGRFRLFEPPSHLTPLADFVAVDGKNKVWGVTRTGALRFDPVTEKFTDFLVPTAGNYDVAGDVDGNGWWAIMMHDKLGFADTQTGKTEEITLIPRKEMEDIATPKDREFYDSVAKGASSQNPNIGFPWAQAPRRLGADPNGPTLWVANWFGQNIAEVDTRTHRVTYHPAPLPESSPYDTDVDANHVVYVSLRNAEAIGKFDPATGQWTVFSLPTQGVEARHISVDRRRNEVWIPYWRTSKVARLQFRTEAQLRAAGGQ